MQQGSTDPSNDALRTGLHSRQHRKTVSKQVGSRIQQLKYCFRDSKMHRGFLQNRQHKTNQGLVPSWHPKREKFYESHSIESFIALTKLCNQSLLVGTVAERLYDAVMIYLHVLKHSDLKYLPSNLTSFEAGFMLEASARPAECHSQMSAHVLLVLLIFGVSAPEITSITRLTSLSVRLSIVTVAHPPPAPQPDPAAIATSGRVSEEN
ncbi:hypothetical protein GGX14DRAFT_398821 [Mycena pura]|uniref:Uncharacterized protein n=1 Tax=Mycena pura TaxID=153505 RepID=A0AAD6V6C0_9AGAR|nr:hypothetical protein GGX14DRAFT_398821 [Mycena pura]